MKFARVRIVVLGLPLVAFGVGLGCLGQADHSYFDDLLDGSVDGTTPRLEASPGNDAPTGPDGDVVIMTDDGGPDATDDAVAADDGATDGDARGDAGVDAAADAMDAAPDAPVVEAGCVPSNTIASCGACGTSCDTAHSSPTSCTAGSCVYSGCDAGWGDCNKSAPNADGCESRLNTTANCTQCNVACDTASSIGAACTGTTCSYSDCKAGFADCDQTPPNANGCETPQSSIKHATGIPNVSYYDCAPPKTYTIKQALEACTAYTGDGSQCASFACQNPRTGPIVCSQGALNKDCVCWSYGGTNVGYVDNAGQLPGDAGVNCFCPSTTIDPMWN
jgi:hypothetical protein